jgi:hypothetical protein
MKTQGSKNTSIRTKDTKPFFALTEHPEIPHLDLDVITDSPQPTAMVSRLEAWNALNKRIIASSQWTNERRSCSSVRSLPKSSDRFSAEQSEYLKQQLAQLTAPLLDSKQMLLEATEAIAESQPTISESTAVRRRALEASALKQLKLVQEGTRTLEAHKPHPRVNPFHVVPELHLERAQKPRGSLPSSVRSSQERLKPTTAMSNRYRRFYDKCFEHRMTAVTERRLADREDLEIREWLSKLRKSVAKKGAKLKPNHVTEAVADFKSEKLVFVYGPQFRGRYISKTHGDFLKI